MNVASAGALDFITATIPEFRRISGISRSRIYELLDAGELESVHVGSRRLIVVRSYLDLIQRLQGAQASAASPRRNTDQPSRP